MSDSFYPENRKNFLLERCVRCGMCLGICPVYSIFRLETESPRGRLEFMKALADNETISHQGLKVPLAHCLFCLQCQRDCPASVAFDLYFFRAMAILKRKNAYPSKDVSNPRGIRTAVKISSKGLMDWVKEESRRTRGKSNDIIIFPGCLNPLDEIKGIQTALKNNGIKAIIMPEGICCGLPYLLEGDQKRALECMRKNMDIFRKIYTKNLFITCPFCLKMFKSYYPFYLNYKIEMEFRPIGDLFLSMKLISVNTQSKKIAYHTPCLLDIHVSSRHQQMIKKLAGSSYIIIPDRICCGHGFGLPSQDTEISGIICATNLNKILEKGVQVLITDCPSCTMHWIDGAQKINCDLEVIPYWRFILNPSLEN